MDNQVEWTQAAVRELGKIDRRYQKAIREKVGRLADFPQVALDIKHLDGNQYRLRHGDYRIFFQVVDGRPKIIRIESVKRRTDRTYKH